MAIGDSVLDWDAKFRKDKGGRWPPVLAEAALLQ
jgi:hypothetical protein